MSGYSKLFAEIVTSSIWSEDDKTRLVWITMLALKDSRGYVPAALPGLANAARVTVDECAAAVAKLEAPDQYSRTPDHDGRRIQKVDGGWRVLNHEKYREKRCDDERREYQRRLMQRRRHPEMLANVSHVSTNVSTVSTMLAHSESDAESDTDKNKNKNSPSPAAPVAFEQFWKTYPRKIGKQAALRIWQRNKLTNRLDAILKALDWQAKSEQWQTEAGRYIPHPATWLNQGRWEDEPPKPASKPYAGKPPDKREMYDRAVRDIVLELHKRNATLKRQDWGDYITSLRDKYRDMPGVLDEAAGIYKNQRRMANEKTREVAGNG